MKRNGYTIAEAMITLAIIGIVASLTIPTFVAAYRKHIYASSLAVAVANFETGMTMMMAKEGVDDLLETEAWKAIENSMTYSSSESAIKKFRICVNKTLPLTEYKTAAIKYSSLAAPASTPTLLVGRPVRFPTKNGVEYMLHIDGVSKDNEKDEATFYSQGSNYLNKAAEVYIDINGEKDPNIQGRDWFRYDLGTDGRLYPYRGQDACAYNGWEYANTRTKCAIEKRGEYCSAYLKENGYKMDY
jgi:prepilin-type N-terminal cleavage/methylation domain-containing protein